MTYGVYAREVKLLAHGVNVQPVMEYLAVDLERRMVIPRNIT